MHAVPDMMVPTIGPFKESLKSITCQEPQDDSHDDGDRDVDEIHDLGTLSLGHSQEAGKKNDDEDIVAGGPGPPGIKNPRCLSCKRQGFLNPYSSKKSLQVLKPCRPSHFLKSIGRGQEKLVLFHA